MFKKTLAALMVLGAVTATAFVPSYARAQDNDADAAAAEAALANAPVGPARILTINRQLVVGASDMGQDVVRQAKQIEDQLKATTQKKLEEFAAMEADLKQKKDILSPEKFQAEIQAYAQKRQEADREMQIEAARLQRGLLVAQEKVFAAAAPIFAEIMQARGSNMLLDSNAIIASVQGQDITKIVVDRMNATGDRITLVLPEVRTGEGDGAN